MTRMIKEFEDFVNRKDIDVISVDIKIVEQNCMFQEGFAGIIYYKQLSEQKTI